MPIIHKNRIIKIFNTSLRHGFVSIICGGSEYFLFLFFYSFLGLNLPISYLIPYLFATIIGYFFHNFFTFKINKVNLQSSLFYILQATLVLLMGYLIVKSLLILNISAKLAKLIQLCATFIFNVWFGRYVTFNAKSN